MPLISKGENEAEDFEVAIKSKGGDCWHCGSGMISDVVLDGKHPWHGSHFDENKEVRRRTVQEVRTRRYAMEGPRPNTRITHP